MIVVADTSPLNYLLLAGAIDVLPALYEIVYAPPRVLQELTDLRTPGAVRAWAEQRPGWLILKQPTADLDLPLHPGEADAITLAKEINANLLMIDERRGTREARALGLNTIGTLGVLYEAAEQGLIRLPDVIDALVTRTTFRCDPALIDGLLRRLRERRP